MEKYYYLDSKGEQQGPIELEHFTMYGVGLDTLIWQEGMPDWTEAKRVPEVWAVLSQAQGAVPPPLPHFTPKSAVPVVAKPDNLMIWSILATVFCCLPFGIAAIVYSNKVDDRWNAKDYAGAMDAARNAKMFCLISLGGGILIFIFYIIMLIAGVSASL